MPVSPELSAYLQQLKKKGMSDNAARTVLLNARFAPSDIEEAIQANNAPQDTPEPKISSTIPPPQSSPAKRTIPLVAIIAIVILLGAGSALGYFYYAHTQLTPEQVVQNMLENVTNIKTATFSGNLTWNTYPQTGTSANALIAGTQSTTTAVLQFNGEADLNDLAHVAQSSTIHIAGQSGTVQGSGDIHLISLGGVYYFKLDNLDSGNAGVFNPMASMISFLTGQWFKIDPGGIAKMIYGDRATEISQLQSSLQPTLSTDTIQKIKDAALQYHIVGIAQTFPNETLNGQSVYHYKITIDKDAAAKFIAGIYPLLYDRNSPLFVSSTDELVAAAKTTLADYQINNLELWIGTKDFYPYKLSFDVSSLVQSQKVGDAVAEVQFSNFNQPLAITAPEDAKDIGAILGGFFGVKTSSTISARNDFMNAVAPAGNEMLSESRDATRLSDLANLKAIIQLYLADGGTLASCKAGVIYQSNHGTTALDGTGWLPINFQSDQSTASIFNKLPVDPHNTGNYVYGFKCDPATNEFKLTAAMESQKYSRGGPNDVVSKDGGTNPNLYEVGTGLNL